MNRTPLVPLLMMASALITAAEEKPRVFVTESMPLQVSGRNDGAPVAVSGGASPESIEVMKQLQRRCPEVVITGDREKADYTIRLDHEPANPTTLFVHGNKLAVFNKSQDLIFGDSTHLLRTAVDKACAAIKGAQK